MHYQIYQRFCVFTTSHWRLKYNLQSVITECQGAPCSKKTRYLKCLCCWFESCWRNLYGKYLNGSYLNNFLNLWNISFQDISVIFDYNIKYSLLSVFEKWKSAVGKGKYFDVLLTYLSKYLTVFLLNFDLRNYTLARRNTATYLLSRIGPPPYL